MTRLTPKAIHELRILGEAGSEDLDRDVAVKEIVMCKVHDRHPALTDHFDQPVAASENALGQYHAVIPS